MIQAIKGNRSESKPVEKKEKQQDIYVTKYETVVKYEDGKRIEERIEKRVNVTKLVQETAKTIKRDTATELVKKMENLLTEAKNEKK